MPAGALKYIVAYDGSDDTFVTEGFEAGDAGVGAPECESSTCAVMTAVMTHATTVRATDAHAGIGLLHARASLRADEAVDVGPG